MVCGLYSTEAKNGWKWHELYKSAMIIGMKCEIETGCKRNHTCVSNNPREVCKLKGVHIYYTIIPDIHIVLFSFFVLHFL